MPEPQTAYDYDTIGEGYYDEVFHRNRGVQSKWHHLKFRHVRAAMPANYRNHLDIACGPGTFIGTLSAEAPSLGTDIADAQIAYARERYGTDAHRFERNDPGALPYADASFDVVTMIELIEHLEMPAIEALLSEVRRVLTPGGKLVITTPNYASLWPVLEKIVNRVSAVSYEDQHVTFFRRGRLSALLEKSGFIQRRVTTFQGIAPFAAALSWKLADALQPAENSALRPALGFLLLGESHKD